MILPVPFSSRRPLKVERGRKKSDLIPERRMEKKKGERALACCHSGEERERRDPGKGSPGKGRDPQGPSQHCRGPDIVSESIYRVCRDSELLSIHPLLILAHPNPSSPEGPLGLCLTLEMQEETKPLPAG